MAVSRIIGSQSKMVFVLVAFLLLIASCGLLPVMESESNGPDVTASTVSVEDVVDALLNDPDFLAMVTGLQGPQGEQGPQGPSGDPGLEIDDPAEVADNLLNDPDFLELVQGDPGISCWDDDGDGRCDAQEDVNNDGACDALDCQSNGGEGDITAVVAGSGLTGGGESGSVTLNVDSAGITSTHLGNASVITSKIAGGAVSLAKIDVEGAASGQVIKYDGNDVVWDNDNSGGSGFWQSGGGGIFYDEGAIGLGEVCSTGICINGGAGDIEFDMRGGNNLIEILADDPEEEVLDVQGIALISDLDVDLDIDVGDDVRITDQLTVSGTKNFLIDHPLDPQNLYLRHSCVESWERVNIYDGTALLDENGRASVDLPRWFEALNRDFRYQLTAIGAPMPQLHIVEKMDGNKFEIAGGVPGHHVSWQVTGVRRDAYAEANPFRVEEEKSPEERGYFLHPELFGESVSRGIYQIRRSRAK